MDKFFNINHPIYKPIWVRLLLTASCLGWAAFEFSTNAAFWGMLFLAMGACCVWCFFVTFRRE